MTDMNACQLDPENAIGAYSIFVRCGAVTGTVTVTHEGTFAFTPESARPRNPFGWLFSLMRPLRYQSIPVEQLLGARLESPCAFTVWHAVEYTARMGCITKRLYHVRHTHRFDVSDPRAAEEVVGRIRRVASWWGRDKPPHLAAIVNPKAGQGGAVRLFRGRLLPLLRDVAGLRVLELVTTGPGDATEMMRGLPLRPPGGILAGGRGATATAAAGGCEGNAVEESASTAAAAAGGDAVDAVMFVGGDGTLHEGLQGLMQRPDWSTAREVPLVAVPCGSGNGVAASSGLWDLSTAAVAICRGRCSPVDVATALQPPGNRFYCLLSVVYGTMANLDVGTNHMRWMGELRFHLGALREIIRGRCYSCRAFVLPADTAAVPEGHAGASQPGGAAGEVAAAPVTGTGPCSAVTILEAAGHRGGGKGGGDMQKPLLQGAGPLPPAYRSGCSGSADSPGDVNGSLEGTCLSQYPSGPPLPLLSQLSNLPAHLPDSPSALPRGWQQLGDSFAIFGAYNTQYLALGARANPGGRMSDGAWEVWQLAVQGNRAGAGLRLRCLRVLLGVEDGSFAKTPGVMHVTKARAMLFQQRDSATWTVLDGEPVPEAPLYLEVHPGLCRLLVSPVFSEEPL